MKSLDFLGANSVHLILDRGFFSEKNVDDMLERRHHFTIAVPTGRKWVENYIDKHYETIASPDNYQQINDTEALFAVTNLHKWGKNERRTYLHIYFNAQQAAVEFDKFTLKLLKYKQELESGKRIEAHEEAYTRFFIVKETPKRGCKISFNDAAIQQQRKRYAGFFAILSSSIKNPMEALRVYRAKDVVADLPFVASRNLACK
jgi:hypothetical protein